MSLLCKLRELGIICPACSGSRKSSRNIDEVIEKERSDAAHETSADPYLPTGEMACHGMYVIERAGSPCVWHRHRVMEMREFSINRRIDNNRHADIDINRGFCEKSDAQIIAVDERLTPPNADPDGLCARHQRQSSILKASA